MAPTLTKASTAVSNDLIRKPDTVDNSKRIDLTYNFVDNAFITLVIAHRFDAILLKVIILMHISNFRPVNG